MSKTPISTTDKTQPPVYEIRIKGHLDAQWADWFEGLTITPADDGGTLLAGPVADQAALHGLLKKVRDLGLPLVSVNQTFIQETHQDRSNKESEMNKNSIPAQLEDKQAKLSTLWIFIMFNMVFADIFSFMYPGFLQQIMAGNAEGTPITPVFLLIAAIVTEVSIAMVFLSRMLKYRVNRWVNIAGGVITILWVIGGGSAVPHYIFIASIEVVCSLVIIWLAWQWRNPEFQP